MNKRREESFGLILLSITNGFNQTLRNLKTHSPSLAAGDVSHLCSSAVMPPPLDTKKSSPPILQSLFLKIHLLVTILGPGDTAVNETGIPLSFWGLQSSRKETLHKCTLHSRLREWCKVRQELEESHEIWPRGPGRASWKTIKAEAKGQWALPESLTSGGDSGTG